MLTAKIAASSSGANQIVAGVTGVRYRVIAFAISFSGSVNAKWQTGTTDVTGLFYGAAAAVAQSPTLPVPTRQVQPPAQFETNAGDDLTLNLSGATAVGGYVCYERVAVGATS